MGGLYNNNNNNNNISEVLSIEKSKASVTYDVSLSINFMA